MADTFEASGATPRRCKPRSPSSPSTLDAAIASLRVQRPFLAELDDVLRGLLAARRAELRGALPDINPALEAGTRVQQARARRSTSGSRTRFDALHDLAAAPSTNAAHPRADRDGQDAQPAAALLRPVRDGLQLRRTTSGRTSPSTSPRPTAPAWRSARCSTSPASRTTRSARWAPTQPANGEERRAGQQAVPARASPYGAAITPDGNADCETGQRGYLERNAALRPDRTSTIDQRRAHARRPGPDLHGPRARARGRDVHVDPRDRPVRDHARVLER